MDREKRYDVTVIGSGAGLLIVENAVAQGLSVALVERGPFGGTCLNLGCIPSKMLIYPADRVAEIRDAGRLGVTARVERVDFAGIMARMRNKVAEGERHVRRALAESEGVDVYEGTGSFVADHTMEVDGRTIAGEKVFIAAGARPRIPAIPGLDEIDYLTNETVLDLTERPEHVAVVGGGYVAAEYAHFFWGMGSRVTLVQRNARLVPDEEPEVSELLRAELSERMDVRTGTAVIGFRKRGQGCTVEAEDRSSGEITEIHVDKVMLATGRVSNADALHLDRTGVEIDDRGFVRVNEYLETSSDGIWAFGDIIGKEMFRHVANKEASLVWNNIVGSNRTPMDYLTAPHAVFSYPEIASVGLTEAEAREKISIGELLVGRANYTQVARGEAMVAERAFAKAVATKDGAILGFHIIGPHASILIQEVVNTIANGLDLWSIGKTMHIHPALTELVVATLGNLRPVK